MTTLAGIGPQPGHSHHKVLRDNTKGHSVPLETEDHPWKRGFLGVGMDVPFRAE